MENTLSYSFIFHKLENLVQEKYPDKYSVIRSHGEAIRQKMQILELIQIRFQHSSALMEEWWKETHENLQLYVTSADPEILKRGNEFGKRGMLARTSIITDIESFLVFSRVVLDYIPWMLQPICQGIITSQEPKTYDFRQFCEWFINNPDKIIIQEFYDFISDFYDWFIPNLREPRNDLVVHLKRRYTLDSFSDDGSISRMKYIQGSGVKEGPEDTFQLPSVPVLYSELIEYLHSLENLLIKIL